MKEFLVVSFTLVLSMQAAVAESFFVPDPDGYPIFEDGFVECPPNYDKRSTCKILAADFGFFDDARNRGFQAAAGLLTDGASIPFWAQGFIGKPHEKAFSRAATLHDYYVLDENAVYSYWVTQRMFYDVLILSGVEKKTAQNMYLAVLVGARKWSLFYTAEPEECVDMEGLNCFRDGLVTPPEDIRNSTDAVYQIEGFQNAILEASSDAGFEDLSLEAIEELAVKIREDLGVITPPPVVFGDAEAASQ